MANQIKATVIADSINGKGDRLTSIIGVFPRIILSEVNTHRALSRNSASLRAIPFKKVVEMVVDDPFVPMKWMKEHKGMQGSEFFQKEEEIEQLKAEWLIARDGAVLNANVLHDLGLSKQMCNRIMEPFMMQTALISFTEIENFTYLRANSSAEIHFNHFAEEVISALNKSNATTLIEGQWHMPFGDKINDDLLKAMLVDGEFDEFLSKDFKENGNNIEALKRMISVARCARVSYMNHEGEHRYKDDIRLYCNLLANKHLSPFEHIAQATVYHTSKCGNFKGFNQLRKILMPYGDDDMKDSRVKKYLGSEGSI